MPSPRSLFLTRPVLLAIPLALAATACTARWPLASSTPTPAGGANAPESRPVRSLGLATSADPELAGSDAAATRSTTRSTRPTRTPTRPPAAPAEIAVTTELVAEGLDKPVAVTHAGDGSGRLFVVEKEGRVRIVAAGRVLPEPFLDISDHVESESGERGLLGLAFHPDYRDNGIFFVNYTTSRTTGPLDRGDTVVARFTVGADAEVADPARERTILTVSQPYSNHNGGHLLFGPDGYLYIGLGDGGSQGDPDNRAQNLSDLLGKMLRIDVDTGGPDDARGLDDADANDLDRSAPYDIPPDNPFVDEPPARPEVWAYGFRNPWRYSFDPLTGDLYIGDVGGSQWEEIDFQPAASRGGENYGWPILEAAECHKPAEGCDGTGLAPPIAYYSHDEGTAITAGEVYRGRRFPRLAGTFFYGDYGTGALWALSRAAGGPWRNAKVGEAKGGLSAFGRGEDGEVYLTLYSTGELRRLVEADDGAEPEGTTESRGPIDRKVAGRGG